MTTAPERGAGRRVSILGLPVDGVTMDEALERIEGFLETADRTRLVITADASGIVQAQSDPELKALYHSADLVTPDGAGILWAARRQNTPLPDRVSGVDLVARLCQRS
ncbi:MAG TPA: WecB/TagA/CpsF family glycosyltransferase, partial [Fimbriimonas sp.]